MTATLTLNGNTPYTHRLPDGFGMVAISPYRMSTTQDAGNDTWKTAVAAMGAESLRCHMWNSTYDPVVQAGQIAVAKYLNVPTCVQVDMRPNPWINSTRSPVDLANIQPSSANGSPKACVDVIAQFVNAGVNVKWAEPYNEPAGNRSVQHPGPPITYTGNERWFYDGTGGVTCEVWASVFLRNFITELAARYPSIVPAGGVYATNECTYGISGAKSVIRGLSDLQGGYVWPASLGANWDIPGWMYNSHPYPGSGGGQGTGTDQSIFNSMFYTTPGIEDGTTAAGHATRNGARMTAFHEYLRGWLTANGKGGLRFGHTEFGWFLPDSRGGMADIAYMVAGARDQARWALDYITYFSVNATQYGVSNYADNVIAGNPAGSTGNYIKTVRYYSQQMAFDFSHFYKKQLFNGKNVPWTVAPDMTPVGADNNSVYCLQAAAGYETINGTELNVLIANGHLTLPKDVTIVLTNMTTSGANISIKKFGTGQANDSVPATTTIAAATTFTVTIPAAGAASIKIPINPTTGFTGGGGSPPTNSGGANLPTVSGSAVAGATLTAGNGTWSGSPTSYNYQWLQDGAPILGSIAQTYVVSGGDVGHTLSVRVTAVNANGSTSATSAATATVTAAGTLPLLEATTVLSAENINGGATTGTLAATITANANRMLLVYFGARYPDSPDWIRWNGVDLTRLVSSLSDQNPPRGEWWYLLNPDAGAHNLTWENGSANTTGLIMESWYNAVQAAPTLGTPAKSGSAGSPTGTISASATDEVMIAGASIWNTTNAGTVTAGAGTLDIQRRVWDGGNGVIVATAHRIGQGGTTTVTFTPSGVVTGAWTFSQLKIQGVAVVSAPVNTVAPGISGTQQEGSTLTVSDGTWTGTGVSITGRQWYRDGVAISGETATTYVLVAADVGHVITAAVTASNTGGSTQATSDSTGVILPLPPGNTALPTITGTVTLGSLLTDTTGAWSRTPSGYSHQWYRTDSDGSNVTAITGATVSTYTVAVADQTKKLFVRITASNAGGSTTADSASTAAVPTVAPTNATLPSITGSALVGATLTGDDGTWNNSPTSFTRKWRRYNPDGSGGVDIAGATGATYVVDLADVGKKIGFTVTATNAGGSSSANSTLTLTVPLSAPVSLTPPVITGTALVGQTLNAGFGTWSNVPDEYDVQWFRCDQDGLNCTEVIGAVSTVYPVTDTDIGRTLKVRITAINMTGSAEATSAPTNTIPPVILPPTAAQRSLARVSVGAPHFLHPFSFQDSGLGVQANVGEQDTAAEIETATETILRYRPGQRIEKPDFGTPDQTFSQGGADLEEITAGVLHWEPRAEALISQETDGIDPLIARVKAEVRTPTVESEGSG